MICSLGEFEFCRKGCTLSTTKCLQEYYSIKLYKIATLRRNTDKQLTNFDLCDSIFSTHTHKNIKHFVILCMHTFLPQFKNNLGTEFSEQWSKFMLLPVKILTKRICLFFNSPHLLEHGIIRFLKININPE